MEHQSVIAKGAAVTAKRKKKRVTKRRGAVAAFSIVAMVPLLGMSAIALDVGMLYVAHTEAQSSSDAASLAGALTRHWCLPTITTPSTKTRSQGIWAFNSAPGQLIGQLQYSPVRCVQRLPHGA